MTFAMDIARELVRNAIKAKGLKMADYPASQITSAAKALLEAQGLDGAIISAAPAHVAAEAE